MNEPLTAMFGDKITILMYHSVNPTPDMYSVSPSTFRRQIEFIAEHYPVMALKDVAEQFGTSPTRKVVITFDDAFSDFAEFAYPILQRWSVPVTMFAPTALLGKWNSWDEYKRHVTRKSVMTGQDLYELSRDRLVDIGSHTVDHVSMRSLVPGEMHRQAATSRRELETLLNRPVTMFSYPYGQRHDFSTETQSILSKVGFTIAVTTCWGTRNRPSEILRLRRISLAETDNLRTIRAKIEGYYDWIGLKEYMAFAWRTGLRRLTH